MLNNRLRKRFSIFAPSKFIYELTIQVCVELLATLVATKLIPF